MRMNSKVAFFAWLPQWEAGTGVAVGRGELANHVAGWRYVLFEVISSRRDNGNGNSSKKFQDETIYLILWTMKMYVYVDFIYNLNI